MGDSEVEQITEADALLAESPTWDGEGGRLLWVDIESGDVHSLEVETGRRNRWHAGAPLGALGLASDSGHLVLALGGSLYLADEATRTMEVIARLELNKPELRLNDCACDAAGRLWSGSMRIDATGREGALYRVVRERGAISVRRMLDSVGLSNGIAWSPDETLMYYIDTLTHRIDVIDFEPATGELGERRALVDMNPGRPDGMAVDTEGFLWVALPSHGEVRRYSPAGALDGVIRFPVRRVTSCCFGGRNLDELYVTSARDRSTEPGRPPSGGAIYRCRPRSRGVQVHKFR